MEEIKQFYKAMWSAIEHIAGKLVDGDWAHTQKASAVFGKGIRSVC